MASDLGVITGTVYTDKTDNGLTGDDTLLSGITVNLYRDGGNATYDNGAGDDVLVTSATTNGSGVYTFDTLIAGLYYVQQAAASGTIQRTAETVKTVTITNTDAEGVAGQVIDSFSTSQTVLSNTQNVPATDAINAAEAIGGQREMFAELTSASGTVELVANASTPGILEFNSSATGSGTRIITYDGLAENDAASVDGTGLGDLDLTAGGTRVAFKLTLGADAVGSLMIRAYSSLTNFSATTVTMPNTGGAATSTVIVRFSDFATAGGTGADFTAINALQFEFLTGSVDGQIDLIETVAPTTFTSNAANLTPMTIGDLVFRDLNNNGLKDTSETGISGVTVQLYADTNANGTYDAGTDTLNSTTTTNGSGIYSFANLFPGDYIAVIPASMFTTGQPLEGFVSSTGNDPVPDPDDDVDNDDNGALVGSVIATQALTLIAGGEPTTDGDSDVNTNLTLDFGMVPQVDLQIVKTDSPDPVTAGNRLTYTLAATNDGPATATGVVVTDVLPVGVTFVSATSNVGTVAEASGTVTATVGTLIDNQTATITIIVQVPSSRTSSITNTATIAGNEFDSDNTNNSSSAATAVNTVTDLSITKSDSPDPVVSAGQLTYTLTVTNNGPSDATGVTVTDVLPAGVTFVSANSSQGSATEATGTITGALGAIASGASATVTVIVSVDSATTGPISNTATVTGNETDSDNTNNSASASTTVTRQINLGITKTDSADPIVPGQQLTYTITVTNAGPSTATNVSVTDVLPSGVTFVSATPSQGTANNASGTITGSLGTLNSGSSATIAVVVTVNSNAPTSLSNTATVTATETDTDTSDNSATQTTTVNQQLDVAITKVDTPDPVVAGNNITYTLTVTNNGPSDASTVTVTDSLPTGLTFVSATPSQGTANNSSGTITANLGALANGASATITIVATVSASFTGSLSNTATVTSSGTETDSANNTATAATTVNRNVDMRITKTDSTDPLIAGNNETYTLTVFNDGPSEATGVTVTDVLPAGVTFSSVTSSQGTASNSSGTVTALLGTMAPNTSATITLIVTSAPGLRGTLSNTATVTANETEVNSANNSATASTTVNGSVDLAITKTDSSDPIVAGGALTYTITVTNNGVSTANNVTVTDVLPSGLTFTSGSASSGSVSNSNGTVTGSLGTIAPGASVTMTLVTAVSSSATGTLSNTASVTATETDTNTANNSATQGTTIATVGSIAGSVYIDTNKNGVQDTGEAGIPNVPISLSGTDQLGNAVSRSTTTDANGAYLFSNLVPGTYSVSQPTQPAGFTDGASNVGTGATGTAATNQITQITLGSGANAQAFSFGEQVEPLSKRRFLSSST
ncbi:MAG: SdrD B-like domain-containing protein [Pirellulales bacterium]